jgi:YesN/AraC family two-component response regulator
MQRAAFPAPGGLDATSAFKGELLMNPSHIVKILIVEDEPLIRMDLAGLLAEMGFLIVETANADDAIIELEIDSAIRAVITDLEMPGTMDGLALTFMVQSRWPSCRLIVVSGHRTPHLADMPYGCRFIRKPLRTRDLQMTLSEMGVCA